MTQEEFDVAMKAHLTDLKLKTDSVLHPGELKVLNDLRNRGFAVCVFTPKELDEGKISRKTMEEILVESGNEILIDVELSTTWRNPEDHK
jgi:phosphoglycolate phosphatase-like HAD superfamily hydrolase